MNDLALRLIYSSFEGGAWILALYLLLRVVKVSPAIRCWAWRLATLRLALSAVVPLNIALAVLPATKKVELAYAPTAVAEPSTPILPTAFLWIWVMGAILLLSKTFLDSVRLAKRLANALPVTDSALLELATESSRRLGRQRPTLLQTDFLQGPATMGILRPKVFLSPETLTWSLSDLRMALAHEIAHVRRQDWGFALLMRCLRCIFWWLPPVWLAEARQRLDAERSADALAIKVTAATRADYGRMLLQAFSRPATAGVLGISSFARPAAERLSELGRIGRSSRFSLAALLCIGVVALPSWHFAERPSPRELVAAVAPRSRSVTFANPAAAAIAQPAVPLTVHYYQSRVTSPHRKLNRRREVPKPAIVQVGVEVTEPAKSAPSPTPSAAQSSQITPTPTPTAMATPAMPARAPRQTRPPQGNTAPLSLGEAPEANIDPDNAPNYSGRLDRNARSAPRARGS